VWCELVANGIGGRTIAEAQSVMSYREFLVWLAYRKRRGTLNTGLRLDGGFALLASLYANAHSKDGGFTPANFMPYEDEREVSLDEAMSEWT